MSEFKGTKGKWDYTENSWDVTTVSSGEDEICVIRADEEECIKSPDRESEILLIQEANAKLIADAGNVRQQINFDLPELLRQRNEMLEALKEVHKKLSDYGGGNAPFTKKIEKLIKEATEL